MQISEGQYYFSFFIHYALIYMFDCKTGNAVFLNSPFNLGKYNVPESVFLRCSLKTFNVNHSFSVVIG